MIHVDIFFRLRHLVLMKIILLSDRQLATKLDYDKNYDKTPLYKMVIYKLPLIVIVSP